MLDYESRESRIHAAGTKAMRQEAARLLKQDREALDARCEDSRCMASTNCEHCAPPVACCECDSEGGEV